MNELITTHKRESDSENKDEISASKKLKVESSEENGSKEVTFLIEADAAEDKGLRQSMEDEWVVLIDAVKDYPGNLRFLFSFLVFTLIFHHFFVNLLKCCLAMSETCVFIKCFSNFVGNSVSGLKSTNL